MMSLLVNDGFVGWLLQAVPYALLYETEFLTVVIKS